MSSLRIVISLCVFVGVNCIGVASVNAAVPNYLTFQGKLKDADGALLSGTYSIVFALYNVASGGSPIWSETQASVTVVDGMFSVKLGSISSIDQSHFQEATRYLGITVGADPELTPRLQVTSSSYAFRVATIDGALGGAISGAVSTGYGIFANGVRSYGQFLENNQIGGAAIISLSDNNAGYDNTGIVGYGRYGSNLNTGVYGRATDAPLAPGENCAGIYGESQGYAGGTVWAGYFNGWTSVNGNFYASEKFFKIDDPKNPAEKILTHACVESDELKNFYDGLVTLDDHGEVVVKLPEWFDGLNTEYRYQLTCVGGYAPVYIASKISGNEFKIAGGAPGLEVSWMVTGVRKDAYALAHPFKVIEEKPVGQRGKYLHPKEHGVCEELGVDYATRKYFDEPVKLKNKVE